MNIIETHNLSFDYQSDNNTPLHALCSVDLCVSEGEYIAVLGRNGSGKSTLAKLLNMILEPTGGRVMLFGRDVTAADFSYEDMLNVRRDIGMVFQNPDNQLVATVVEEDVAFGPENLALPREEIRRRVNNALSLVGMTEYAHHAPHKLSGGQKQRVAIAGVLAMKPRVILFDEATAMLDPIGRRDILAIMERLNREEGITVLNITHYMDEAVRANRVIVMDNGRIAMDGTPCQVFSKVEALSRMGLEAPQSAELVSLLRKDGCGLPDGILTPDACAEALLTLLGGASHE